MKVRSIQTNEPGIGIKEHPNATTPDHRGRCRDLGEAHAYTARMIMDQMGGNRSLDLGYALEWRYGFISSFASGGEMFLETG
ncbi:hypothetical protein JOH52_006754 [Sinorhizobium meliloti]|uniref:hypothetical protein n=1 Tax=Rhizobium meliloti TaxID=382 RepID=UPI0003686AC4|nr:hypothetical protein [Sinorhizobium meliloti]MBP2470662.1 hypothetical protein [Sinorhizobium meliloti]MDE3786145.1 hypothetical protein [Sinorhizobium meliloti]MDE4550500.1 hypothetical protein [Sinorhizobium meliloti]MDE4598081.1 hypothetical protein [Sinorhizobium meliloti]RVO71686.1 hypothetical protein CN091_29210 [Sinorhizobium meliloti]